MMIAARVQRAQVAATKAELERLAADPSPQVRRQVAANKSTSGQVLGWLAADRDWRVRAAVAAQVGVPATAAMKLVEDKVWQVRYALADNRHSDPAVWQAITRAADVGIRKVFVQNAWLPVEIAELCRLDPAKDVRQTLAVCTPHRHVLGALLKDPHQDVRADALRNRLVGVDELVEAAHDPHLVVRAAAAGNPRLPAVERELLLRDRSQYVREAATRPWVSPEPDVAVLVDGGGEGVPDLTDPAVLASWPVSPTKPRTTWLKLFHDYSGGQNVVPDHVVWFWRYSLRIDRDRAWRQWWAGSAAAKLGIVIWPGRARGIKIQRSDGMLSVVASSPEILALLHQEETGDLETDDMFTDRLVDLLMPTLEYALAEVGKVEDLGSPPPLPPRP